MEVANRYVNTTHLVQELSVSNTVASVNRGK